MPMFSPLESMDRSYIAAIQCKRLKAQIEKCYSLSPFYRRKLAEIGFEPGDFRSLDDISRLPFTMKHELRDSQGHIPPWGELALPDPGTWVEIHPTTGTTGAPIYSIWSQKDIGNITDYASRMLTTIGVKPGDILLNAFRYGLRMGGITVQRVAEKLGCFVLPIGDSQIRTHIELMLNIRPTVLFAMPSFAFQLIEKLRERGIFPEELAFRVGCFSGEPGASIAATRSRLENGLGLTAFDMYGLTEIGPLLAAECEARDGLHCAEDHHYIEIIDPATMMPCREGETGILVITDLTRDAMPLLRFWTNDLTSASYAPCPCGRTHVKLKGGIQGRTDDIVIFRGIKFYPVQVEKVLRQFDELANEFKIVLKKNKHTDMDECIIQAECLFSGYGMDVLQDKVLRELHEELKVGVKAEFVPFGSLGRENIKTQRVVDSRNR